MNVPPVSSSLAGGMLATFASSTSYSSLLSSAPDEPICVSGGTLEGDIRRLKAVAALTSVFWDASRWILYSPLVVFSLLAKYLQVCLVWPRVLRAYVSLVEQPWEIANISLGSHF